MNDNAQLKARLHVIGLAILVAGLLAALLIYQTVADEPQGGVGYVIVDGVSYPIDPQSSRRYLRGLEEFGGKGAVLIDEFNRWFEALWHGKKLGITVGCLSVLVSLGIFLFANYALPDRD
jgi:hypothetical protein